MRRVTIKAVGDIVIRSDGAGLESIGSLLEGADIVIGTCETPFSARGWRAEKLFAFRCDPARSKELASHFHVLSLANNHSMDFGWPALEDTIHNLGHSGTLTVGAGPTFGEASKPVFLRVNDTRVGFVAFSTLLPVGIRASAERPGIAGVRVRTSYEINPEALQEEPGMPPFIRTHVLPDDQAWLEQLTKDAASECDALIVIAHIGYGADRRLQEYESPLAESLLKAGAACVLGDHVHTIRGASFGPSGLVIYGLNNFIKQFTPFEPSTDQRELMEAQRAVIGADQPCGLVASIDLDEGKCTGGTFSPIRYDPSGLPTVPSPEEARSALSIFKDLCTNLGWQPSWAESGDMLRWKA